MNTTYTKWERLIKDNDTKHILIIRWEYDREKNAIRARIFKYEIEILSWWMHTQIREGGDNSCRTLSHSKSMGYVVHAGVFEVNTPSPSGSVFDRHWF